MKDSKKKIFIIKNGNISDILPLDKVDSLKSLDKNASVFIGDDKTMHRICQQQRWHYIKMIEHADKEGIRELMNKAI